MSFTVPAVPPVENTYAAETIIGEKLIRAMQPWITLHLAWYLDAIGAMFQQCAQLVLDQGIDGDPTYLPGYGTLLDPTVATGQDLQYLGQFVGVPVPNGLPDATARALVLAEGGLKRGTLPAVISAVQRNLSGTQSVALLERYGPSGPDPWWFTIIVRPEEIVSLTALKSAVNATKPGGVLFQIIEADGYTWAQAIHTWQTDTMSWAQSATIQP